MYVQANPAKGRTKQEKDEAKQRYSVGEQVLPPVKWVRKNSVDEEDRRMIEEVRQLSLREVGVGSSEPHERHTRNGGTDGHRDSRAEEARRQRRRDHDRRRMGEASVPYHATSSSSQGLEDPQTRARQIEHQSSLRSLISSSDSNFSEIDEEVLRQIVDEMLQDGLDLDNLNPMQEDEISERIANALRQGRRPRSGETRISQSRESNHISQRSERDQAHLRRYERTPVTVDQTVQSSRPSVSQPHLLHANPINQESRQRKSSNHRRQTSPATISPSTRSSETRRQATGSAADLSNPLRSANDHRRQTSSSQGLASMRASTEAHRQAARSTTDLSNPQPSSPRERTQSSDTPDRRRRVPDLGRRGEDTPRTTRNQSPKLQTKAEKGLEANSNPRNTNVPPLSASTVAATQSASIRPPNRTIVIEDSRNQWPPYPSDNPSTMQKNPTPLSVMPSVESSRRAEVLIRCNRCDRPNLEQGLHLNCSICLDGHYNLCVRCYRQGLGCLHWFGFGHAALPKYEQLAPPGGYPPDHAPPHVLIGHHYIALSQASNGVMGEEFVQGGGKTRSLQSGIFCSRCAEFAEQLYWKCDICNEGEWGFCNRCVNQGKCCSHPLLPIAHTSTQPSSDFFSEFQYTQLSFAPITNLESMEPRKRAFPLGSYIPLTCSRKCDICQFPIPPLITHFHCPQCNDGDYDICTACYVNLNSEFEISPENGLKGWRRCLNHHRMIVVGFEDSPAGQRRVIVNDLVGGHALKDDISVSNPSDQLQVKDEEFRWQDGQMVQTHIIKRPGLSTPTQSLRKFPPDGGVGMRVLALWSYWPGPEADDELAFPKGAVVSEVENINGDWFWGIYAGAKGLFSANYVKVLEEIVA